MQESCGDRFESKQVHRARRGEQGHKKERKKDKKKKIERNNEKIITDNQKTMKKERSQDKVRQEVTRVVPWCERTQMIQTCHTNFRGRVQMYSLSSS